MGSLMTETDNSIESDCFNICTVKPVLSDHPFR